MKIFKSKFNPPVSFSHFLVNYFPISPPTIFKQNMQKLNRLNFFDLAWDFCYLQILSTSFKIEKEPPFCLSVSNNSTISYHSKGDKKRLINASRNHTLNNLKIQYLTMVMSIQKTSLLLSSLDEQTPSNSHFEDQTSNNLKTVFNNGDASIENDT